MTATTTAPTSAPATGRKLDRPPTTRTRFDPEQFLLVPPRTFEQLNLGDVFRAPSRTLTDAHTLAFQALSMDNQRSELVLTGEQHLVLRLTPGSKPDAKQ